MLDLEADTCPQRHVEKILSVALKHRCLSEEHSTLVHCGRTKVFLTQVMVSHLKSVCFITNKQAYLFLEFLQLLIFYFFCCILFVCSCSLVSGINVPVFFFFLSTLTCLTRLTARFTGRSEEEDPVSLRLYHSVLLATVPAGQTAHPPPVCYFDPSR